LPSTYLLFRPLCFVLFFFLAVLEIKPESLVRQADIPPPSHTPPALLFIWNSGLVVFAVLYIFWIQVLYQICDFRYFIPEYSLSFHVLGCVFEEQKFIILWNLICYILFIFIVYGLSKLLSWRCLSMLAFSKTFKMLCLSFRSMPHFVLFLWMEVDVNWGICIYIFICARLGRNIYIHLCM
jgi:hypothetical protein